MRQVGGKRDQWSEGVSGSLYGLQLCTVVCLFTHRTASVPPLSGAEKNT